jgi:ferritin-like metal-binding protein YciE
MSLFGSFEFNSLEDLFVEQIKDLYDAENRIIKALPKMSGAAHSAVLKRAFDQHLAQTRHHVERLESVFAALNMTPEGETCDAMKGLLSEAEEMIDAKGDPTVKDAALIAAAQRVEHYEIAAYGTARSLAQHLGQSESANLLQATLDEEKQTDKKLTEIAENEVNVHAVH